MVLFAWRTRLRNSAAHNPSVIAGNDLRNEAPVGVGGVEGIGVVGVPHIFASAEEAAVGVVGQSLAVVNAGILVAGGEVGEVVGERWDGVAGVGKLPSSPLKGEVQAD